MLYSPFNATNSLPLVLLTCAVSGCAQGITGFGFGIVAMSLLPLVLDARASAILVVLLTVLVTLKTFHMHWRDFRLQQIWKHLIGSVLGAILGSFFLVHTDPVIFQKALGSTLLVLGLYNILLAGRAKFHCPAWLAFPMGALGGVLGGAFNMGGPPAAIYLYSQGWPRATVIAALQATFFVTVLVRLPAIAISGHVTGSLLVLAGLAILPCMAGLWVGSRLSAKIPQDRFHIMISILIVVVSIKYLLL